jgi:hypothetical protein
VGAWLKGKVRRDSVHIIDTEFLQIQEMFFEIRNQFVEVSGVRFVRHGSR